MFLTGDIGHGSAYLVKKQWSKMSHLSSGTDLHHGCGPEALRLVAAVACLDY
jgi:hypothetical protein